MRAATEAVLRNLANPMGRRQRVKVHQPERGDISLAGGIISTHALGALT